MCRVPVYMGKGPNSIVSEIPSSSSSPWSGVPFEEFTVLSNGHTVLYSVTAFQRDDSFACGLVVCHFSPYGNTLCPCRIKVMSV